MLPSESLAGGLQTQITAREIIPKISGKMGEEGRDNCCDVLSILIHKKRILDFFP